MQLKAPENASKWILSLEFLCHGVSTRFSKTLLLPLAQKQCHPSSQLLSWHMDCLFFLWFCSLWLGQRGSPQAHDESAVMESASTLDAFLHLRVGDLHLCAALHVMDHVAFDHMGIQTLHWAWGRTHATGVFSFTAHSRYSLRLLVWYLMHEDQMQPGLKATGRSGLKWWKSAICYSTVAFPCS